MKLKVYERLLLLNIMPKESDLTTLRIIRSLKESLSFSEEEHKALEFKHEGANILWKEEADVEKDIIIGEKANDIIVESLKALNRAKKLTESHIPLFEKFIKE